MKKWIPVSRKLSHKFVEFIPEQLQEGVLYVSTTYATAVHLCFCGCGREVVTPLSPTDWKLIFDGETVSLSPSIGNWSFPCRSHYWIKDNFVQWCDDIPLKSVNVGRAIDRLLKAAYFDEWCSSNNTRPSQVAVAPAHGEVGGTPEKVANGDRNGRTARLLTWLRAKICRRAD